MSSLLMNLSIVFGVMVSWSPNALSHVVLEALLEDTIRIPCDVPLKVNDDVVEFVFWYKDEEVTSLYTLDARDKSLAEAIHVKNETYRYRTQFYVTTKPPYLQIDLLQADDSGLYFCRVDYQWSSTFVSQFKLIVVVPPILSITRDGSRTEIIDVAGPYKENEDVYLICQSQGGFPSPNLTWWRGDELSDVTYQTYPGGVINEFHIRNLRREDLNAEFHCRAENSEIAPPTIKTIRIDLLLRPLTARIVTNSVSFSTSRFADVKCESLGSRPAAKITWWLNQTLLQNSSQTVQDDKTIGSLRFLPKPKHDRMPLICLAENTQLRNSTVSDSHHLNVTYIPEVSIAPSEAKRNKTLREGNYFRLQCHINSNPYIMNSGWIFNGIPLSLNFTNGLFMSSNSLVFKNLMRDHMGRYKCFAINPEGKGESDEFFLKISHAPVCKKGQQITYSTHLNHAVIVRCEVESDPENVTFKWGFSNSLARHYNLTYTSQGLVSFVRYIPIEMSDYRTLYCWARNIVGEQQRACFFTVVEPVAAASSVECQNYTSGQHSRFRELLKKCKEQYNIAGKNRTDDNEGSGGFGGTMYLIGSSIGLSLCFTGLLSGYYLYVSYRKKANAQMEAMLDDEMRMYHCQCDSEDIPKEIVTSKS